MQVETTERRGASGWLRPMLVVGVVAGTAAACFWGRAGILSQARAVQLLSARKPAAPAPAPAATPPTEYSQRVVAYINDTVPLTREEFGDYLIARGGAEKLELFVNKRIIEFYCKEKGVEVTAAEVEEALADDLKSLGGINVKQFVDTVLKRYNKTLYEWKEDVIKPKLALAKLCRDRVRVTEKDLQDAFEAHYGEKVDCRLILFPKDQAKIALDVHAKVRDSEEEFSRYARQQASPSLAAVGGHVNPFARHFTGNDLLEKEAFSLKPGEVSAVVDTPEGPVILKCDRRLPPDTSKKLEQERAALEKEVLERKVQAEIPVLFKELREKAHPNLILAASRREDDLLREVHKELSAGEAGPARAMPPSDRRP